MFTIGADPELFVMKDGAVVPIMGMLGGTKEKPLPVGVSGFAVQEDNVMAEYNIPPTDDAGMFGDYIVFGTHAVLRKLEENGHQCAPHLGCAVKFTGQQLAHPQAQVFGCSPDFNAYQQGAPLPRIQPHQLYAEDGDGGAWRFAGGHVHLGYKEHVTDIPEFVVAALCDVFLSLPMIAREMDRQGMRRQFYGSPGRYRPTRYGIEYRTLGNSWIHRRSSAVQVGGYTCNLFAALQRGERYIRRIYNDVPWNDVRRAISTEDAGLAVALRDHLSDYGLEVG